VTKIEIYSKQWCPYCTKAKMLLHSMGLEYEKKGVTSDLSLEQEMIERSQHRSVPQIFIKVCLSVNGWIILFRINSNMTL
jgi:glutaredoxin